VYGIGNALGVAGSFLLIPLYTHVLSTAEYGELELLYRIADVLILIMFMGVRQAYIRFYFDHNNDSEWHRIVTGTTVFFVFISSVAVTILFLPFQKFVMDTVFHGSVADSVLLMVLSWVPLEMLVNVGLTYFQIRLRSITYVVINVLRLVFYIGLNVWLVYGLNYGVAGVFVAQIAVTGAIALAILGYLVWQREMRLSIPLIRQMLGYGAPYLPAAFFMYVINNSDRFFLGYFDSLDSVGVYALAGKVGMAATMFLVDPFLKVWSPFVFENQSKPNGPAVISRAFTLFTLATITMSLGISVLAPVLLPIVVNEKFAAAYSLIPLVSLATVFYGLTHLADVGILISKQTKYKPLIFGIAAGVSILANAALVPKLGAFGAAGASVLAFLALLVVNFRISTRFYHVPLEMPQLGLMLGAAIVTYLVSLWAGYGAVNTLTGKLACALSLVCFPGILWVGGFFAHLMNPVAKAEAKGAAT
jgi:O-antigen/teichoic acid export membrane protein